MKRLSIGVRLTLWYLAIFAVAQLIFGAGMWFILRGNLLDLLDDDLEAQVDDLKSFLQAQEKDASIAKLREEVNESYSIEHTGDYLELYVDGANLLYRSKFLQDHPFPLLSPDQVHDRVVRNRRVGHQHFRFVFQRLAGVNGHDYLVEMGLPADDVAQTLWMFRTYLLMFAPLLLLVAAAVGFWMSRRALAPVDAIVRSAREIGGTNLNSRLQKLETGDELQRLSDTLNEMLDRIEEAFRRITQFTADASHELRTPVSLIRTEAELALRRPRAEAEYQSSLQNILTESERTTGLIEQLLSLARSDSGRETLHFAPVNLGDQLQRVASDWEKVASIRQLQFSVQGAREEILVMADPSALRRLMDILLDNAMKYTPANGTVRMALTRENQVAVIAVHDSGAGISSEDQPKIFERFYRADSARASVRGSGLGLAIAEWIVQQHRGSIHVESQMGKGTTFYVELALAGNITPGYSTPARTAERG